MIVNAVAAGLHFLVELIPVVGGPLSSVIGVLI